MDSPKNARPHLNHAKDDMPRSYDSLTLEDAKRMLSAAEAKATSLGVAYNIAVVDAGGHLLAFLRQDGALIGSIELAIDKAVTARLFEGDGGPRAACAVRQAAVWHPANQ
jgi:uncharacterized protein GlcG (DUF336 family)